MNVLRYGACLFFAFACTSLTAPAVAQDFAVPASKPTFVTVKVVVEDGLTQIQIRSGQGAQTVEQAYTVKVPYTENGELKYRTEVRTRQVAVAVDDKPKVKLLEDVKLLTVSGKEVDASTAKMRLKNAQPAIQLAEGDKLHPFFAELLKPDAIILVIPK